MKRNCDEELFYDDFVSSRLLNVEMLQRLIGASIVNEEINPNGAALEIVDDDELRVATLQLNTETHPPTVIIHFAGCRVDVDLPTLMNDISMPLQS